MVVRLQSDDFDGGAELAGLMQGRRNTGAAVSFIGYVRDDADKGSPLVEMLIEHYPALATRQLEHIERKAHQRWRLDDTLIVHRFGRLTPGEQIVLVIVLAQHREAAFQGATFIMDVLKSHAPFWKKEIRAGGSQWVEARAHDNAALMTWLNDDSPSKAQTRDQKR